MNKDLNNKEKIYVEELNSKYKHFFKVNNGGNRLSIKSFNDLCYLIENNNGELLSEYINSETNIQFKIEGMILNRLPCNIKRTIESIDNVKDNIFLNGDIINSFYTNDNSTIYINITTYDNANIKLKLTGYTKFLTGRKNFTKLIKENNHIILSPYYNSTTEVLVDFKCGHPPNNITPNEYSNGCRCKICSNRLIVPNINGILTTHPDSLIYFKNKEDASLYSSGSNKRIIFKCPICGHEKTMEISGFFYFGFSCPKCSDGISYPNKFIFNLLCELNEDFETEVKFDWCSFNDFKNSKNINYGLYDVVINNKKLIIEMDGNLGHGGYIHTKSDVGKEESIYKDKMKEELAIKNGYNVIRINCKYKGNQDRYEHIVNSILNSELAKIYDLSNINFLQIHEKCLNSLIKECSDLWNKGYSTSQISSTVHKSVVTIIKYLKDGNMLNWCNYTKEIAEKNRIRLHTNATGKPCVCMCDENVVGYYNSVSRCSRELTDLYRTKFSKTSIYTVCRNEKSKYKDFVFQYITKEEFNNYKSEGRQCYGDFFILSDKNNSKENNLEK